MNIGVIGLGMVGTQVQRWFDAKGHDLWVHDKNKESHSMAEVNENADYIFVCVPTPQAKDGSCDTSIVEDVVSKINDGKVVIIKSTVPPGTTEKLQEKYPLKKMLFNPEFLRERTAWDDFIKPPRQVMGYTRKSYEEAKIIGDTLPDAPCNVAIPATEAELIKYWSNCWLANKLIMANQVYDVCEKLGLVYDRVKKIVLTDPRMGESHLDIWMDGYRGYGGKCLPKDVSAFIQFCKELGLKPELMQTVHKINEGLLKK